MDDDGTNLIEIQYQHTPIARSVSGRLAQTRAEINVMTWELNHEESKELGDGRERFNWPSRSYAWSLRVAIGQVKSRSQALLN